MIKKEHATVIEMIAGILGYEMLAQVILLFIGGNRGSNSIGLWIGGIIAIGMLLHMKRSIEDAIDMGDEEGATKYSRKMYAVRTIIVLLIVGALLMFHIGNIIATIIGIMGLKVSAYIQPYMHRVLSRFENTK